MSHPTANSEPQELQPEPKTCSVSKTTMTQFLRPSHVDSRGFAFGGQILAWIDVCAGVAAKRHAGRNAVTASVDAVHFFQSIKLGELCVVRATVNKAWRTSMEVGVRVEAESVQTGNRRYCCHAYLTFVAVENGKPALVPVAVPETLSEKRRYDHAEDRRAARVARKKAATSEPPHRITEPEDAAETPSVSRTSFTDLGSEVVARPAARASSDSYTEVVELVFPNHANSLGISFGGQIMQWMEYCATVAASRHTRSHLLTASIDSLNFKHPTRVGDTIIIRGIVSEAFAHSLEIYVTVEIESVDGKTQVTNDGWLSMVAVDDYGNKIEVPKLMPVTQEDINRQRGAQERRTLRLVEREHLKQTLGLA